MGVYRTIGPLVIHYKEIRCLALVTLFYNFSTSRNVHIALHIVSWRRSAVNLRDISPKIRVSELGLEFAALESV